MGVSEYRIGILEKGPNNRITDVPGVKVGHVTLSSGGIQTGVTAIIPGEGSAFRNKFPAAVHVINGFGKSVGLMQVQELGNLETPVLLTNTFSVPACEEGLLTYMLRDHPEIGVTTGTVNPVIMECNDGRLNDIRARNVRPEHALEALAAVSEEFEEGAVGAGRGMSCYGWKGGIGSASRVISIEGRTYTVGALLLTNFGAAKDLMICGTKVRKEQREETDKGSCIIVLATDLPMSSRQLLRCARRAQNGLARTGTITGEGSGDVVLMFSTANRIPHTGIDKIRPVEVLHEGCLDTVFRAVAETVEEGVVSSMLHAETVKGFQNKTVKSLRDSGLI